LASFASLVGFQDAIREAVATLELKRNRERIIRDSNPDSIIATAMLRYETLENEIRGALVAYGVEK